MRGGSARDPRKGGHGSAAAAAAAQRAGGGAHVDGGGPRQGGDPKEAVSQQALRCHVGQSPAGAGAVREGEGSKGISRRGDEWAGGAGWCPHGAPTSRTAGGESAAPPGCQTRPHALVKADEDRDGCQGGEAAGKGVDPGGLVHLRGLHLQGKGGRRGGRGRVNGALEEGWQGQPWCRQAAGVGLPKWEERWWKKGARLWLSREAAGAVAAASGLGIIIFGGAWQRKKAAKGSAVDRSTTELCVQDLGRIRDRTRDLSMNAM